MHILPYYLAMVAVTNAQYSRFLTESKPDSAKLAAWIHLETSQPIHKAGNAFAVDPAQADLPAAHVTWEGAVAYSTWAGLRLPTELEWEKGARGVDGRLYPWGEEWEKGRPLPADKERHEEELSAVRAYPSACSPYGLYQMIGGVYEWCAEWYDENAYNRYAQGDLKPPTGGENHLLRGGPWRFGTPVYHRTEYRKGTVWRGGTPMTGFRCAKSI